MGAKKQHFLLRVAISPLEKIKSKHFPADNNSSYQSHFQHPVGPHTCGRLLKMRHLKCSVTVNDMVFTGKFEPEMGKCPFYIDEKHI